MQEHKHQLRVTYQDTDKMGVVYYANYYRWFEIGRTEYLRALGMSYKEVEEKGILIPVVESHCSYHSPARYDEIVTVVTEVRELKRSTIIFDYQVLRDEDQELLATGHTIHVFVNDEFETVSLKKESPAVWELLN
ncbi:acyl-CoA thioesterase [Fuchsiella alkaliacetigena]|uniref:acyl-CoA thioesterase n=1 Tax=Fuchsiella alkaliacetigena TaxID=957042 RepID=UPI00200A89B6|nr:thioesterase family protein [Fuchsiella alkaliacetigena]MCK8825422.1 acyl-CoA thioesterase [Fuchsiella alkaliacetigena]